MFKLLKEYYYIKNSGLFDPTYYLSNYPDVRKADVDPLIHFVKYGWQEKRNPSPRFDTNFYMENNSEVRNSGINPLVHYLKYGQKEGRIPYLGSIKN